MQAFFECEPTRARLRIRSDPAILEFPGGKKETGEPVSLSEK
jgi:hypothetical protein